MSTQPLDPVTFSVVLHRLNSIVDEMTITMEKTAYTSIIALARDYTCAIYDSIPRQICMFEGLPIHANAMHLVIEEIARSFEGDIHEGDVFACNHPYRQNTHVGDLVTAVPVFVEQQHVFWSVTKGHQQDVGAFIASSIAVMARDVWQEGLQIPPIKIHEAGRARDDVIDLYLSNVRYPDLLYGDLLAQLASIERGRLRLLDLVRDYSVDGIERYVDAIVDYADRRMSEEIRAIPDGEYRGEAWVDSDGADALDVPVKARVTIDGASVKVDFEGSGPQSPRGVNSSEACLQAATAIPFMNIVDADIPKNHGCIKHIEATAPEGTITKAKYPASTTTATITPANQIYDAIQKAMVEATPDRVVGGGAPSNNQPDFSGIDQTTGRAWGVLFFNNMGGQGAAKGADGWPIWGSATGMGGLKSLSIEELELLYPMHILHMETEMDSAGFGTWLGGPGNRLAARPTRGPMECTSFGSGYRNPPHGILGGTPGIGGGQYIENRSDGRRRFVSATGHVRIEMDEVWVGVSTGGGGYGNPIEREAESVRRDARDEVISRETAERIFGVMLSCGVDPEIDLEATLKLRARMAKEPRPLVDPTTPGAGRWIDENMSPDDVYVLNPLDV